MRYWGWCALVLLAMLPALATRYYVNENGVDWANGITPATAFRTVSRAAQALNHGDSIVIAPGTYRESVFLADRWGSADARLAIIGDESGKLTNRQAGSIIIEPNILGEPALAFYRCRQLAISGLTLQGTGQGIKLEKCGDVDVRQCTFTGLSRGLAAEGVTTLQVTSAVFTRCGIGLFLKGTTGTTLKHLTVAGATSSGLLALTCGPGSIRNAIFTNNNANFVVDDISAPTWSSDYNVLTGATGPWGAVPTITNVYEWCSASGQDRHSLYVAPKFVNPKTYDLHIDPAVSWGGGLPGATVGEVSGLLVDRDRDGNPFRFIGKSVAAGAYAYPTPRPAAGWQRLPVKLANTTLRQSAGIYQEDGTLLRTLLADATGVQELWWDGLDDQGQPAAAGKFQVKTLTHDVRVVDDGPVGDNGNPKGAYNCDNADRVVALPDGGFIVTTPYDEAGYPLRRYSATGQSIFASALVDGIFWGVAYNGDDLYGGLGSGEKMKLIRLALPGERVPMLNGEEAYTILAPAEKGVTPAGLTVCCGNAFIALKGLNVVRVISLATGKRVIDWPVPDVGDLFRTPDKRLWVLSGTDIVSLGTDGKIDKRYPTTLAAPLYLAAWRNRLAVVDRKNCKLAILNADTGELIRTLGVDRADTSQYWLPVNPNTLRDPRGVAYLADGRLALTEHARVRLCWPENPTESVDLVSNFMESAVTHPQKPEYLYCGLGIFQVEQKTGAWKWLAEAPTMNFMYEEDKDPWAGKRLGSPAQSVLLAGRPFIAFHTHDAKSGGLVKLFDVTDPLKPRLALEAKEIPAIYQTMAFSKGGDIVLSTQQSLAHRVIKFTGLDAQKNPIYDLTTVTKVGPAKDPNILRNMKDVGALTADQKTGDLYYLATTAFYNKMVPGWGADGTGVGKSTPDGTPQWFALSSGGNYMSISAVNDGKRAWVLAGKSFGGQLDVFDADGLRVTTGNWSFPSNYSIGFVDLRYGVHAYLRPDGKVGAYVEDDAIGRFARCRLDGMDTVQKQTTPITWGGQSAPAGIAPVADQISGETLARQQVIKKVKELPVDGNWTLWSNAGVTPQIISLPCNVGFKRTIADDLLQTFREGTLIGALAHDGNNLYVYTVVADNTPRFDATDPAAMWMFDGIEFWVEEEQIGLGLLKDGTPALFKWRFHNLKGEQWKANYALPRENIWGQKIADLATHPLGRQLAALTGTSFTGKPGYALMAKIPFAEIKLVGGIAGRDGTKILDMTGKPGELLRIAVTLNNISSWGRSQDYQIDWPVGKMYSDPTRSYPFALGE